jgi:hypothetical protein
MILTILGFFAVLVILPLALFAAMWYTEFIMELFDRYDL